MSELLRCPVIDCHVHIHGAKGAPGLGTVLRQGRLAGVAIQSIPAFEDYGPGQNAGALLAKARWPGRVYVFGGLSYADGTDLPAQAQRLAAMGCDGLKMIEGKPGTRREIGDLPLDSSCYDGVYAFLEARGLPLLAHVGDPAAFWDPARCPAWAASAGWGWFDPRYPTLERPRAEVANVLRRHPRLQTILAHFYFLSEDRGTAARFLDAFPHANLDLTPGMEMYEDFTRDPGGWRDFFLAYQDRLLFGTDNVSYRREQTMADCADRVLRLRRFLETAETVELMGCTVRGLALPREVLEKIYAGNFHRFAGSTPKPIALPEALAEADRAVALAHTPQYRHHLADCRRLRERLARIMARPE